MDLTRGTFCCSEALFEEFNNWKPYWRIKHVWEIFEGECLWIFSKAHQYRWIFATINCYHIKRHLKKKSWKVSWQLICFLLYNCPCNWFYGYIQQRKQAENRHFTQWIHSKVPPKIKCASWYITITFCCSEALFVELNNLKPPFVNEIK